MTVWQGAQSNQLESSLANTNGFNPLLNLDYEPALEALGDDYFDVVMAADFPQHILRFRNDDVLQQVGLDPGPGDSD